MGTPEKPSFIFLIEEGHRELQSRLMLAVIAASRGAVVTLGQQWLLNRHLAALPKSVILFKGNNAIQSRNMAQASAAGHAVASIEEEGLGLSNSGEITRLYDPDVGKNCDLVLAQGDFQRDALVAAWPELQHKVLVTGNPRTDLLAAPLNQPIFEQGEANRRKFGRYVLVNTNFGSINPAFNDVLGYYRRCVQTNIIDPKNPRDIKDFLTWCDWERANLHAIVETVKRLENGGLDTPASDTKVIIRPHPAENLQRWQEYLGESDNRLIRREGDHLGWSAGAEMVVHTSCTTGLEAALLGRPSLSLIPGDNPWHALYTANLVNHTAKTAEQAATMVFDHLRGHIDLGEFDAGSREKLRHHLALADPDSASLRVVSALEQLWDRCLAGRRTDAMESGSMAGEIDDRAMSGWQETKLASNLNDIQTEVSRLGTLLGLAPGFEVTQRAEAVFQIQHPTVGGK